VEFGLSNNEGLRKRYDGQVCDCDGQVCRSQVCDCTVCVRDYESASEWRMPFKTKSWSAMIVGLHCVLLRRSMALQVSVDNSK